MYFSALNLIFCLTVILHLALSLAHQHCRPSSSSSSFHQQNGVIGGEDVASTSSGTKRCFGAPYWRDLDGGGEQSPLSQSSSRYSIPLTMSPSSDCAVCKMLLPKGGPVRFFCFAFFVCFFCFPLFFN
ncbi:unnamed protein product [Meloidogyne enterolobii]|uniref:Uncharacterized protein n=1 Tax=Meloidogyne enterolobii TaxID=390850 RepID=A0ACB0YKS0_MELEN